MKSRLQLLSEDLQELPESATGPVVRQSFTLEDGESFEIELFGLAFTGRRDIAVDKTLVLDAEYLTFDLTPMRNDWVDAYQQLSGTIIVNVTGWGSIDYNF